MAVSVIEAAEYYGVEVKRGKALCLFHDDRHPSMLVADDHYHCFACGEHGDVIDRMLPDGKLEKLQNHLKKTERVV